MELTAEATRLVIILCSILGGLLLFFVPIGVALYIRHRSRLSQQKKNNLQLNEE